jgi:hypothetical protein
VISANELRLPRLIINFYLENIFRMLLSWLSQMKIVSLSFAAVFARRHCGWQTDDCRVQNYNYERRFLFHINYSINQSFQYLFNNQESIGSTSQSKSIPAIFESRQFVILTNIGCYVHSFLHLSNTESINQS